MALYSQIEDRYLSALTAVQFPDPPVAETQQPVSDATSVDGMQLAAGPSQTRSDAGGGMGEIKPIPRNRAQEALGFVGELLTKAGVQLDQYGLDVPGLGRITLKDLTVGEAGKVLEDMSYGFMPVRGGNSATGGIGTFGLKPDASMELLNVAPAAGAVAKAGVKGAAKGIEKALTAKASKTALNWTERETAPVGSWIKADFKTADTQPVYQVQEIGVNDLYLPELDASGRLQPEKRRYLPEYTKRAKAGETPPSISVIEMDDGRLRVVDGHRRVMAAREAGIEKIRALVSPLVNTPDGKQEATVENLKLKAKEQK